MTAELIGAIILWLIVAIVAIAIIVYLVNWLYLRSSKEVSFVRTGLMGERVVIDSGAFVLPGFGKLVLANRKARIGRNPQTGEPIKIPAKRVCKFRLAKSLKDTVLGKK